MQTYGILLKPQEGGMQQQNKNYASLYCPTPGLLFKNYTKIATFLSQICDTGVEVLYYSGVPGVLQFVIRELMFFIVVMYQICDTGVEVLYYSGIPGVLQFVILELMFFIVVMYLGCQDTYVSLSSTQAAILYTKLAYIKTLQQEASKL